MQNFDTELDRVGVTHMVRETTRVMHRRPLMLDTTHKAIDETRWTHKELHHYIVTEMQERFGTDGRLEQVVREYSAVKAFIGRHGMETALAVAHYVFDVCNGQWMGRPVNMSVWCKASDPYFGLPIIERLA